MARIEEKIAEIADPALRQIIAEEVANLKKHTRFGLVFEDHQPEVVPIYGKRIKRGERVAKKTGTLSEIWRVVSVKDGLAVCEQEKGGKTLAETRESFPTQQLVVIRSMGETIYPSLTPVDSVTNGDPAAPNHVLIEADNYHALQLLLFPYEGKVDCIYIDPPYNTGARDWKYNNDYVDKNDQWQHSKWLSMMKRRLYLAIRLLRDDGLMCITIDDYELAHLVMLLEDFPQVTVVGCVPIKNKPQGRPTATGFSVNHEYAIFATIDDSAEIGRLPRKGSKADRYPEVDAAGIFAWANFRKSGSDSRRTDRRKQYYPVFVKGDLVRVPAMRWDNTDQIWTDIQNAEDDEEIVWPNDDDGAERVWSLGSERTRTELASLKVVRGQNTIQIQRKYRPNQDGALPGTWWDDPLYSASESGTKLLQKILGSTESFSFPKSVYAVIDCLRACGIGAKSDSLTVDFFAGSATTLNAVNLLNAGDSGKRQCILVTNNEVSEDKSRDLTAQGFQPGQDEWEQHGICRSVTWPRSKFTLLGKRDDGTPLPGDYITGKQVTREKSRAIRHLGFAEGRNLPLVQRKQVAALMPGVTQSKIDDGPWFLDNDVAVSVLWDVRQAPAWLDALSDADHVNDLCVVTTESRLFNALKAQIIETLGPQEVIEDEKRPLATGFAANLEYFRLDFLDPQEIQMGRQFAAVLPILWMMAGARGLRPIAPDAHAPWLLPDGCPFVVLMQETRFKEFVRHVESRTDLTHVFIVTNSQDTVYKLRREWPELRVVQLYKDYLENFRINLSEKPAQ